MVRKEKCYTNCVLLSKCEVQMEALGPRYGCSVVDQQVQRLKDPKSDSPQVYTLGRVIGWIDVSTGT